MALATLAFWNAFPPVNGTFAARQNTSFRFVHPAKAFAPIEEMPSGMETDARFVHPSYLLLVDYQYYTL